MNVPDFNHNIYPCEFCDYFISKQSAQEHTYACNKQGLSITQKEDNDNDKPCRLLLIYCPLKERI